MLDNNSINNDLIDNNSLNNDLINNLLEINNLNCNISDKREFIISDILKNIFKYKRTAKIHIYYLKLLMFITLCILYEFNYFNIKNFIIISFLIIFNIAFTENMLFNLFIPEYKIESKMILENQKKINKLVLENKLEEIIRI